MMSYEKRVKKIIEEKGFILDSASEQLLKERLNNGRRYFYIVLPRKEGGDIVSRFLKVPSRNTRKILDPFARQIDISKYFKLHGTILTRGIIDSETNPKNGETFAIMETLPKSKIGFIEGFNGAELLNEEHAKKIVDALERIHSIDVNSLPTSLQVNLVDYKGDFNNLKKEVLKYLNKKITNHIDGKIEEPFHLILERRLGMKDFKEKALKLLQSVKSIVFDGIKESSRFLVHGDMAPNNLYIYDNGDVEFLDMEWMGSSTNRSMSMVFDYGNLRARSWNNKIFREALDLEVLNYYKKQGNAELGKAIVCLGILRSHTMLSGFFENYDKEKQIIEEEKNRKESTEKDIVKAWDIWGTV